jgi:hypothetical protein
MLLDAAASAAIGVALAIVVTIGYFILRFSGRISERGFLEGVKQARAGSERANGTPPN